MAEEKLGFFARLKAGLAKTRQHLSSDFDRTFLGHDRVDDDFYDELEEVLIMDDIGIHATDEIMENLRRKVEAGADYVVTQMFYSNEAFYRFRDACQQAGISVPIIPGLKPITTPRQVNMLPRTFHIDLPQPLVENLRRHPDDARKVGTEWCISQSQDLIAHGVPAIHYYTMGRPDDISLIVRSTF